MTTTPTKSRAGGKLVGMMIVAGFVLLAGATTTYVVQTRHDRAAVILLRSDDSEARQRGAWQAAHEDTPWAAHLLPSLLEKETVPAAREALVYALGRAGTAASFDALLDVARTDATPYVRHSAWLAAARVAPQQFATTADKLTPGPDAWDRIGWAQAWLEVGDARGVPDLLALLDSAQRDHALGARGAVLRYVAPLLEMVGHWPLAAPSEAADEWTPAFVAELRARCAAVDLAELARALATDRTRLTRVQHDVGRLHRARERIARLLFDVGGSIEEERD